MVVEKTSISQKKGVVSLRIENVVVSVDFGIPINLDLLQKKYKDIVKKDNFPGLIVKMRSPKATILIFRTGKVILTGLKHSRYAPRIVEKLNKKLENANIEIKSKPIVGIENIVTRGDFHQSLNLDLINLFLKRSIYEPEVFPGIIYKQKEPKICFLIFASGKIICTGAKSEKQIRKNVKKLALDLKKNDVFGSEKQEDFFDQESLDLPDF